jgi:hypothetical protein
MKKLLTPILVILILAWSAYAALVGWLFPNTWDFPRVPQVNGTLGNILAKILGESDIEPYAWDGTVNNTLALNGITSTWYLQHKECEVWTVWKKVEDNGTVTCGFRSAPLVEAWTLTWVTNNLTIFRWGWGVGIPWSNWDTLYYGDLVETAVSSSGTIIFSDASIIRLDESTTVELSQWENTDWDTIAQLILKDGNLWWRVLTSTGINFEAGGYIAWVRGTSISIEKSSTGYTFAIVDSIASGNSAEIINKETEGWQSILLGSWGVFAISNEGISGKSSTTKNTLLMWNTWRSSNTLQDIGYLMGLVANSDWLTPELLTRYTQEFEVTAPQFEDTSLCSALEKWTSLNCSEDSNPNNIPDDLRWVDSTIARIKQELKARNMVCRDKYDAIFWPTIGKCVKKQNGKEVLFTADYTSTPFSDPDQFWPLPPPINSKFTEMSTVLANIINWTELSKAMLLWRTMKVVPMYEENYTTSISDYGYLWVIGGLNLLGDYSTGMIDWHEYIKRNIQTILSKAPEWIWNFGGSNLGRFIDVNFLIEKKTAWYTDIFVPRQHSPLPSPVVTYPYTPILRKPSHFPTPDPNGISINTTGDFIGYSLSELWGGTSLANKTITIKVAGSQTRGWTLVDFWNINWTSYRIYKFWTAQYKCVWDGSTTCVTTNATWNELTFQVPYIPGWNTIKYLVLWNNYDAILVPTTINSLSKPLGWYIQGIQIKN